MAGYGLETTRAYTELVGIGPELIQTHQLISISLLRPQ